MTRSYNSDVTALSRLRHRWRNLGYDIDGVTTLTYFLLVNKKQVDDFAEVAQGLAAFKPYMFSGFSAEIKNSNETPKKWLVRSLEGSQIQKTMKEYKTKIGVG